jgi:hypothetical protein
VLVWGDGELPLDRCTDLAYTGAPTRPVVSALPAGRAPCLEFTCWYESQPYRDITTWKARAVHDYPADPHEDPDGGDPQLWAKTRHAEPYSITVWEVVLSCGHITTTQADPEWKPEHGISYRIDPADEAAMARRAEILAYPGVNEDSKHRFEQMLPHPHPDEPCGFCARDKVITAYEFIGPLVPPQRVRERPDPRAALQQRLADAERTAERLRAELAAMDEDNTRDR